MLKGFTLFVLSILLSMSLMVATIGTATQVLLYPDVYETTLEKHNAYDMIEHQLVQQGVMAKAIFSQQEAEPTLKRLLRNTLSYLRGDTTKLDLTLNLSVKEYFLLRAEEFPVCRSNQQPFQGEEIVCRPSNVEPEQFVDAALEMQGIDIEELSQVNLAEVYDRDQNIEQLKEGIRIFQYVVYASWFISFALVLMMFLLTRKSFKSFAHWMDMDLFTVGISLVAPGLFLKDYLPKLLQLQLPLLENILLDIVFTVIEGMMYYGFIILGVAIFLLVTSWFVKDKKTKKRIKKKRKKKKSKRK